MSDISPRTISAIDTRLGNIEREIASVNSKLAEAIHLLQQLLDADQAKDDDE